MKALLFIFLGISIANAAHGGRQLTPDEVLQLKNFVYSAFDESYKASALERELERESVVGRALLLLEKKTKFQTSAREVDDEFFAFRDERFPSIPWLSDWSEAYIHLSWVASSNLASYELSNREIAKEYSDLIASLQESMLAAAESNGEIAEISKMKESKAKISLLSDVAETLKSRRMNEHSLSSDEASALKLSQFVVFDKLCQASDLEYALQAEEIVGRALLILEEKRKLESSAEDAAAELADLLSRRRVEIGWLSDWYSAYITLTIGTPKRIAMYKRVDKENAGSYSDLVSAFQQSMLAVIDSNGDSLKIEAMKKLRDELSNHNERGSR